MTPARTSFLLTVVLVLFAPRLAQQHLCHHGAAPCLYLRGGGRAYQKPGRRPYVERHTPGQVDSRDVPHHTEYKISPDFDVDKQRWYTGAVEDPKAFWGAVGPPPLPDEVPEVVKLALGDRINRPINVEIAMSWVLATDPRLKERFRSSRRGSCFMRVHCCVLTRNHKAIPRVHAPSRSRVPSKTCPRRTLSSAHA